MGTETSQKNRHICSSVSHQHANTNTQCPQTDLSNTRTGGNKTIKRHLSNHGEQAQRSSGILPRNGTAVRRVIVLPATASLLCRSFIEVLPTEGAKFLFLVVGHLRDGENGLDGEVCACVYACV